MNSVDLIELSKDKWFALEQQVYRTKAAYFSRFKFALVERQKALNAHSLLSNLWVIEEYGGAIGARYDPRLYWRIHSAERDSFRLEFEVGEGIKIKKGHKPTDNLKSFSGVLHELFPAEKGWFGSEDSMLYNDSFFDISNIPAKRKMEEIWLLGNETDPYADRLFSFMEPYLTDEKIIKLFLSAESPVEM